MSGAVLDDWQAVTELAQRLGIRPGEPFCRMCLGRVDGIVCEACDVIVPVEAGWRVHALRLRRDKGV